MKFVLSMPLAPAGMEMMEKLGIQWEVGPGINWEAYPDALLESADALIVRLEKCPESVLRRCRNLKVLGRPGMGFENVPVDWCTERGIPVVLAPGANARSVAEHALALIFACAKDLKEMDEENRKGNWGIRAQGKADGAGGQNRGHCGGGRHRQPAGRDVPGSGHGMHRLEPFPQPGPGGGRRLPVCGDPGRSAPDQ